MVLVSIVGLVAFVSFAWLYGGRRQAVNLRLIGWGIGLQLALGLMVFRTGLGQSALLVVNDMTNAIVSSAASGPAFVLGSLTDVAATSRAGLGFILFSQGLLSIIVISAMLQLLYQIGVMGWIVRLFATVFSRLMRISGVEALAASANIIVGNESIITVRPFLDRMTGSELCVLMTACMATVSANMMGAYVSMLGGVFPGIAGHLASASLLSAPAALLASKLALPETESPETLGVNVRPDVDRAPNLIAAIMSGAEAGGRLLIGVSLLLIAVVGLLGIADRALGWLGGNVNELLGWNWQWSFVGLFGLVFRPAAWLMGVPWGETAMVGEMLGIRMITTEVGAYSRLAELLAEAAITPRSAAIAAYSLCGFAHIPAMAITAGGVAALAPSRRDELSAIAPRAFIAATLACLMTGCVAGIFAVDSVMLLQGGG